MGSSAPRIFIATGLWKLRPLGRLVRCARLIVWGLWPHPRWLFSFWRSAVGLCIPLGELLSILMLSLLLCSLSQLSLLSNLPLALYVSFSLKRYLPLSIPLSLFCFSFQSLSFGERESRVRSIPKWRTLIQRL
jgi:hypothetical protein